MPLPFLGGGIFVVWAVLHNAFILWQGLLFQALFHTAVYRSACRNGLPFSRHKAERF